MARFSSQRSATQVLLSSFLSFLAILPVSPGVAFAEFILPCGDSFGSRAEKVLFSLVGDDSRAFLGLTPTIEILDSPVANAFSRQPNQVTLTSGLLKLLTSDDHVAFVLAHELAHLKQGSTAKLDGAGILHELQADAHAFHMLRSAGFDPHAGYRALSRVLGQQVKILGSNHTISRTLRYRIERLRDPLAILPNPLMQLTQKEFQ